MKKEKHSIVSYIWIVFLVISISLLWLGIKSSVIYSSSDFAPISNYTYERNISNKASIKDVNKHYIIEYEHKIYTIQKDRDSTIILKSTLENKDDIFKTTKESLIYTKDSHEITHRYQTICRDNKEIHEISNLSISHFILVGIPAYFASIIFLLITMFTFSIWKDERKKWWYSEMPSIKLKLSDISYQLFVLCTSLYEFLLAF